MRMTKSLGEKHKLEVIDIFNDRCLFKLVIGLHYQGKDRFVVREEIHAKELA